MPAISTTAGALGYGRPQVVKSSGQGGSLLFSGTSSSYLTTPNNIDFRFSGSFTIEWFQYMQTGNSFPRVFSQGTYSTATIAVSIEGGTFYLWIGGSAVFSFNLTNYLNQWVHFAISRNGSTVRIFQNGTQIGSNVTSAYTSTDTTNNLTIGNETSPSTGAAFKGYITNFRWNTTALYTGNFTRPAAPLTAVSGTVLLLLASTSGTATLDSNSPAKTITNNGNNVTWNTLNPF